MDLVALVTSLHPIDLSALAFRRHEAWSRRAVVLSARSATLSTRPERRVKQAPQSFPTVQLVRESSGTFRQLFVPLESIDGCPDRALDWISSKYPERTHQRQLRALESAARHPVEERLQALLHEVLSTLWPGELVIVDAIRHLGSEVGRAATRRGLARMLQAQPASGPAQPLRFERGGYIELDGSSRITAGSPDDIRRALNESRTVRLGGPLELVYLDALGEPIHLPWYCETVTRRSGDASQGSGNVTVREHVSPISSVSSARSWKSSGSNSLRLDPTGYTLIDYDDASVTEFLDSVVGHPSRPTDMYDWRSLTKRYPRSDQKALKDQFPVAQYVAEEIAQWRRAFTRGASPTPQFRALISPSLELPTVHVLGALSCEVIGVLRVLESTKHQPGLEDHLSPLLRSLQPSAFASAETGAVALFRERVSRLTTAMGAWQHAIAPDEDQLDGFGESTYVSDVALLLDATLHSTPSVRPFPARNESGTSFGALAKHLEAHTRTYYQLVVALLNGPLKANGWNLYSLLGQAAPEVCHSLAQRRPEPYLDLTAQLW